jgi:hypothetical protein
MVVLQGICGRYAAGKRGSEMSDSASVFEQPHSRREASEMRVHLGYELERGKGQIQALSPDRANLTAEREALTAGYGGITGRDRQEALAAIDQRLDEVTRLTAKEETRIGVINSKLELLRSLASGS